MKADAVLLGHRLGIKPEQIRFSSKLEWITENGRLVLRKARVDPRAQTITLFANAIEARHPKDTLARTLVVLTDGIEVLKAWDESQHPRDENGEWTNGGGESSVTKTPEFKAWFGKSKVVDKNGKPQVVYRGQHGGEEGLQTRLDSITFSSSEAASTYAMNPNDHHDTIEGPKVIAAYLRIENPIFENRNDPFVELPWLIDGLGKAEATRIALKFADDIQYTGNWDENYSDKYDSVAALLAANPDELKNLYFAAYKYLDDGEEIAKLKAAGFDGAIHIGNNVTADTVEYRVFDVRQVKSAIGNSGAFNPDDDDISKMRGEGITRLQEWDESEHPRDEDGKFTFGGGGVDFVSPNVADNLDLPHAVSALKGQQHAVLKEAAGFIDEKLGLKGSTKDVVGAWADGAENSIADFHGGTKWADWSKLVTAASMKGYLADQKSVLVFQEKPDRKPRESVALKGAYPNMVGKIDAVVEVNPTSNEIRSLVQEYKNARVITDEDGNLYLWDAEKAIHDQVAGALDLPGDVHKDVWFYYQGRLVSDRYLTGDTVAERLKTGTAEVRETLASLNGDAVLLSFEAKGSLEDIHKNLLTDGLAFHSLVPHDGGATVLAAVVDPGEVKATVAAAKQAAGRYDSRIDFRAGRGEFIGDKLGTGSDREQRDRARSVYAGNIQRSDVPGSQAVWQSVHDRWGQAAHAKSQKVKLLGDGIWDEDEHPRDEDGKFTFSGGDSAGGDSGEGFGGGLVMPEPGPKGPGKSKVAISDFEKDNITLVGLRDKDKAQKFIDHWDSLVGDTPAEFKKEFLGGVPSTMRIDVLSDGRWTIAGNIQGGAAGEYRREIDLRNKTAESAYFKLERGSTKNDIGKKVLAGNMEAYKQLGIEKVTVHANLDVGGYAWAKYGYVPTRSSWSSLSDEILTKLDGGGRHTSSSMYTPESWDEIGEDDQDAIKRHYLNDTADDYYNSEVENWRENGEDLHIAKTELANGFDADQEWSKDAILEVQNDRANDDRPNIPYTASQLADAITITYDEDDYEGKKDPEIEFDDAKLREPNNAPSPDQLTLPGVEPVDLASHLTQDMRDEISDALVTAFNDKAEKDRGDVEPPDYLREQVQEYQEESWDQMDDREKFRFAERNGHLPEVEIENDEEDVDAVDVPEDEADVLRKLASSSDPKSIWAIADSSRGKELLLNTDWYGVIDLKDKQSMDRFNAYVGKKK